MKQTKNKTLILSLIKDDIINSKLVNGLHEMGLDSFNYFLHLSETIFALMEINGNANTDEIYERYIALTKRAKFIDITESHHALDDLAEEVYAELLEWKHKESLSKG